MLTCGLKATHDGGVALIGGNRLIFATEVEKLDGNPRYAAMDDAGIIARALGAYGYTPDDVNSFILDGWGAIGAPGPDSHEAYVPETQVRLTDLGQEHMLRVARYREAPVRNDLAVLRHYSGLPILGRTYDYASSLHITGHILSAYCTSPFASAGEDSYVLVWDGGIFPTLYHVQCRSREIVRVGVLFRMAGNAYGMFARQFSPFRDTDAHGLSTAGKVMAFIATGRVRAPIVRALKEGMRTCNNAQYDFPKRLARIVSESLSGQGFAPADFLASFHQFLQDLLLATLAMQLVADIPRGRNLCISGGCGLNIKWNSAIRDAGLFDRVFVPPFPNDAGSALGAACAGMFLRGPEPWLDWSVYSGPQLVDETLAEGWISRPCSVDALAQLLHESGEPVIVLHGRAELGPRALGARIIFASARDKRMTETLNAIKGREGYRPVAPICLEHAAPQVFEPGSPDPFMLFEHRVRPSWCVRVPAVRHLDGTARLQTVSARDNPFVTELLEAYYLRSGVPVLCNTSANLSGRGFFPSVGAATAWGRVNYVWSNDMLYAREVHQPVG